MGQRPTLKCAACGDPLRRLNNGDFADGRLITRSVTIEALHRDYPSPTTSYGVTGKMGKSEYAIAVCGVCAAKELRHEQEAAENALALSAMLLTDADQEVAS